MRTHTVGCKLAFLLAALAVAACATPKVASAPAASAPQQCWDVQDTVGVYGMCRRQGSDHPHCICFTLVLQNVSPDPETKSTADERNSANAACGTHIDLDARGLQAENRVVDAAGGFI
jgi:hypothetical protein